MASKSALSVVDDILMKKDDRGFFFIGVPQEEGFPWEKARRTVCAVYVGHASSKRIDFVGSIPVERMGAADVSLNEVIDLVYDEESAIGSYLDKMEFDPMFL